MGRVSDSLKSIVKLALHSRRPTITKERQQRTRPLLVMGNGPSLSEAMANGGARWQGMDKMAVNFAVVAPEYFEFKPEYHIIADPQFFAASPVQSVQDFWEAIMRVDWPLTLLVPGRQLKAAARRVAANSHIALLSYNPVGVTGWHWFEDTAYGSGRGMPRPRNVLIAGIMAGIVLGYTKIYLVGADHSWLRGIAINDRNQIVSTFTHFYKESEHEVRRVEQVVASCKLHDYLDSLAVAFRSYHSIARYAAKAGIEIINATPGSYIDAFPRLK